MRKIVGPCTCPVVESLDVSAEAVGLLADVTEGDQPIEPIERCIFEALGHYWTGVLLNSQGRIPNIACVILFHVRQVRPHNLLYEVEEVRREQWRRFLGGRDRDSDRPAISFVERSLIY